MKREKRKLKGKFVPVPYVMMDSDAWKNLSGNTAKIYLEICKRNWQSKNTGMEFIIPYLYYKEKTSISKPVFYKDLKELCTNGFLERTEHGGLYKNSAKYKFSQLWTTSNKTFQNNIKTKNQYEAWGGIVDSKEAITHGISI